MTDLSQYSDEQLMAFAGVGGQKAKTISDYSDHELLAIARPSQKRSVGKMAADLTGASRTSMGPTDSLAVDMSNVLPAAQQGATSLMSSLHKNLISSDVYESDAGDAMFKDAQGNVVPTDKSKHIVLRDPADGRMKVFGRTEETEAGPMESVSKVLTSGLVAGAPTRLPVARGAAEIAAPLKPGQEVAQAAGDLGVSIPKYLASDSMAVQRGTSALRNVPFAGDPLVKAATQTTTQLGEKAGEIAAGFGGGTNVGSGTAAREGLTQWITKDSAATAKKLYDRVDDLVDPSVTVPLRNTGEAAFQIGRTRGAAAITESSGAVGEVMGALNRAEGLTYEGIKTLRGKVGELIDGGILPPGISGGELKQIYGALSKDMREIVRVAGDGKAMEAFERANTYYRLASDRRDALTKIVGRKGDVAPEQVFDRLAAMAGSTSRADISRLAQARKSMGEESWNEFTSGIVARLGRPPGAGPEQFGTFSPERFLTAYSKITPQAKALLFRSTGKGDLATHLDSIATVSGRWKDLQKFGNPSGTAQTIFGGSIGAGLLASPLTTIGSVVGGRVLANLLSRPATAAPVARWSRSYEQLVRNPRSQQLGAFALATRNLLNGLPDKGGKTVTDFLKALQGPVRGTAEDEQ